MKRMGLGLLFSLAALGLLAVPALAESPSQAVKVLSAADQAFLATLAVPVQAPDPTPAAQRPIVGKALCTASANCGSGGTISCSGNNSTTSCSSADQNCSVGQRGFVTCDSVTTQCPNACPQDCDSIDRPCPAFLCNCQNRCAACGGVKTVFCPTTCTCNSPGC